MMNIRHLLQFNLRSLAKSPGFTLTAVLTLAVGIGATSAIFSVVDAVLIRALPYENPSQLVVLSGVKRESGKSEPWPISFPDFEDLRRTNDAFEDLAAYTQLISFNLTEGGDAEHVSGEMVSASYFSLLGVEAFLGRVFTPGEDKVGGASRLVLLSYEMWQRHLGGDRDLNVHDLKLNGESFQILGILPRGFQGMNDGADIWMPVSLASSLLGSHYIEARDTRWLSALGRLRLGVTLDQASAAVDGIAKGLESQYAETNEAMGVRTLSLYESWFGDIRTALLSLFLGAALVLLIACANVANLLVVRAAGRQKETAIRTALGAGRLRLLSQFAVESLILSILGCTLGLMFARWSIGFLVAVSGVDFRSFIRIGVDWRVVGVALGISVVCGLVVGLIPTRVSSKIDLTGTLKSGGRDQGGGSSQRLQRTLVVAEATLAFVLFVGAGLMLKGFQSLVRTDLGLRPDGVLTMRVDLAGEKYRDAEARRLFVSQSMERVRSMPGVKSVSIISPGMPTDGWFGTNFTVEGWETASSDGTVQLLRHHVAPGFFATLGVPLLAGRDFTESDAESSAPVVIVSQALVERYWPGEDAIGKRLKLGPVSAANLPWLEVVGVVGDIQHQGLSENERPAPDVYLAVLQIPPGNPPIYNILVQAEEETVAGLSIPVRRALQEIFPDVPAFDVLTLRERFATQVAGPRFLVILMGVFGSLALILIAVGIYSVISYMVVQSKPEIGLRMAVGAVRSSILRLVVRRGLSLALIGIFLGLVMTIPATRLLGNVLYGINPTDPFILAGASILLLAVAFLAIFFPAHRATRLDPMAVLRNE